jgi:hypothetical protein
MIPILEGRAIRTLEQILMPRQVKNALSTLHCSSLCSHSKESHFTLDKVTSRFPLAFFFALGNDLLLDEDFVCDSKVLFKASCGISLFATLVPAHF